LGTIPQHEPEFPLMDSVTCQLDDPLSISCGHSPGCIIRYFQGSLMLKIERIRL